MKRVEDAVVRTGFCQTRTIAREAVEVAIPGGKMLPRAVRAEMARRVEGWNRPIGVACAEQDGNDTGEW